MVIIKTSAEEVSIHAVSPVSILAAAASWPKAAPAVNTIAPTARLRVLIGQVARHGRLGQSSSMFSSKDQRSAARQVPRGAGPNLARMLVRYARWRTKNKAMLKLQAHGTTTCQPRSTGQVVGFDGAASPPRPPKRGSVPARRRRMLSEWR